MESLFLNITFELRQVAKLCIILRKIILNFNVKNHYFIADQIFRLFMEKASRRNYIERNFWKTCLSWKYQILAHTSILFFDKCEECSRLYAEWRLQFVDANSLNTKSTKISLVWPLDNTNYDKFEYHVDATRHSITRQTEWQRHNLCSILFPSASHTHLSRYIFWVRNVADREGWSLREARRVGTVYHRSRFLENALVDRSWQSQGGCCRDVRFLATRWCLLTRDHHKDHACQIFIFVILPPSLSPNNRANGA